MSTRSTAKLVTYLRHGTPNRHDSDAAAERLATFTVGVTAILGLWDEFPGEFDQVWLDTIDGLRNLVAE